MTTRKQILSAAKKALANHIESFNAFHPIVIDGLNFAQREANPEVLTELYDLFAMFSDLQAAFYNVVNAKFPGTRMESKAFVFADPLVVKPVRIRNWFKFITRKKAEAKKAKAAKADAEAKRTKTGDDVHGDAEQALRRVLSKYTAKGVRKNASARVAIDELTDLINEWYGEADVS